MNLSFFGISEAKALSLDPYFSEGAVIQRSAPIYFSGTGEPGAKLSLSFSGQKSRGQVDENGDWRIELNSMEAGGPHAVEVESGEESLTISELWVGDVWLLSGQSNINWPLKKTEENELAEAQAHSLTAAQQKVRFMNIPVWTTLAPQQKFNPKRQGKKMRWKSLEFPDVQNCSAVGYYFARELSESIQVPVGLVKSAMGGSPIQGWMSYAAVQAANAESRSLLHHANVAKKMQENPERWPTNGDVRMHFAAGGLYNQMIHPLRDISFKGVLWYQGEQNAGNAEKYKKLLPGLVDSWRTLFGKAELPFIIIQLPGFNGKYSDGFKYIREAQLEGVLATDQTRLVVSIDQGHETDIHPPRKAVVGKRSAWAALVQAYDRKAAPLSPLPVACAWDQRKVVVSFDIPIVTAQEAGAAVLEIAGEDQQFYPAEIEIEGVQLTASSDEVRQPYYVRYQWENFPAPPSLLSEQKMPVSPFRFMKE